MFHVKHSNFDKVRLSTKTVFTKFDIDGIRQIDGFFRHKSAWNSTRLDKSSTWYFFVSRETYKVRPNSTKFATIRREKRPILTRFDIIRQKTPNRRHSTKSHVVAQMFHVKHTKIGKIRQNLQCSTWNKYCVVLCRNCSTWNIQDSTNRRHSTSS